MRAVAVGFVAGVIAVTSVFAQPDVTRAKELYQAAEQAMAEKRYADAARDYGAAYDLTKDPALFYKIGSANERAGTCDIALIYYGRYLREGKPSEQHLKLTQERIAACGGSSGDAGSGAVGSADAGAGSGTGSADVGAGSGSAGAGSAIGAGSAEVGAGSADIGAGSADVGAGSAAIATVLPARHRAAWLLVGGSIASFTLGAVLAYSADAAERDVSDLYVGLGGVPPQFTPANQKRFDDLVAEGERYEKLSWAAFGIAGALAVGATIRFLTAKPAEQSVITPTVTPKGAGVSATWRF
jgi:hypothetical protein